MATVTNELEPEEEMNEGPKATPEEMNKGLTAAPEDDVGLTFENALSQKLRLRQKLLKVDHRHTFLNICLESHVVLKGLYIRPEVHYMDGAENQRTSMTLNKIFRSTEKDVCKAFIRHYPKIMKKTDDQLETIEWSIRHHLREKSPGISLSYTTFVDKLEKFENTLRSSLEEKRTHKLSRLTPHTSHAYTPHSHTLHTRHPQTQKNLKTRGNPPYQTPVRREEGITPYHPVSIPSQEQEGKMAHEKSK